MFSARRSQANPKPCDRALCDSPPPMAMMEALEPRLLLSLIGFTEQLPWIVFNSNGTTSYNAAEERFSVSARPLDLYEPPFGDWTGIVSGQMSLNIQVDNAGALIGGTPGDHDLIVSGALGAGNPVETLLTGEVAAFGYYDSASGTDQFDFIFVATGGTLFDAYFGNIDIGIDLVSEMSSFTGDFTVNFGGGAKGDIWGTEALASLGDYVWEDLDKDGIQDEGEPGVEGVTVNLYVDFDGDGLAEPDGADGPSVATMQTDADGYYEFTGLLPGDYFVEFILPEDFTFTDQDADGDDALDSDADQTTGVAIVTNLIAGEHDMTWDAGLVAEQTTGEAAIDIEKWVKELVCPGGGEGLTPGFWKQSQHFDAWTGYIPEQSYEVVFDVNAPGDKSLLDALCSGGGGVYALLRHSTAALLNAAHPNIDYAYTVDEVISMTKRAFATGDYETVKDLFEVQNELEADLNDEPTEPCDPFEGGYGVDADEPTGPIVSVGATVFFTYVVTNPIKPADGGLAIANVVVADDNETPGDTSDDFEPDPVLVDGHNVGDTDQDDQLDFGEEWLYTATEIATAGQHKNIGMVIGTPVDDLGQPAGEDVTDEDAAHYLAGTLPAPDIDIEKFVEVVGSCDVGGEGLTPGFWKQCQHFYAWVGYEPEGLEADQYNDVFDVDAPGDKTLLGALWSGGGGVYALMRHSTAALLNAASPDINYLYTTDQIIAMVQQAYAPGGDFEGTKNLFAAENERGADLHDGPAPTCDPWAYGYGQDADEPTGPVAAVGETVMFTYLVTNPGNVQLSVVVTDDNETPDDPNDDFQPTAVEEDGHNIGDTDGDGLLDPGEEWLYTATKPVEAGQHVNKADVVGTPVDDEGTPIGENVTDSDVAHWLGEGPAPELAAIGDRVWLDENGNGVQDAGEDGVAGVPVKLFDASDDSLVAQTQTDAEGGYLFTGLAPGSYYVEFLKPADTAFTVPDAADDTLDSDANVATGRSGAVALAAGDEDRTVDAGLVPIQTGGGEGCTPGFWKQVQHLDAWRDYLPADSFAAIFGVPAPADFTLWDALRLGGGGANALGRHATAALLNAANPQVDYLYSADEIIAMVQQAYLTGDFESAKNALARENELGCEWERPDVLGSASISGTVYVDRDGDGEQDKKEQGIAGVTVILTGTDILGNAVYRVAMTNRKGEYIFRDLMAGTYAVQEAQPADFADGDDSLGTAGGTVGDDSFTDIDLLANTNALGYDFGEQRDC